MALYPVPPLRKTRSEDRVRDLPQRPTILTSNMAISTGAKPNRPSHLYSSRSHSHGSIPSQDIRPLPSPPTPPSRSGSIRSVRPLPPPPSTSTPSFSEPSLRITPPTPLPPLTPSPSPSTSYNHLAPPKPKTYAFLSVQTSLDSLCAPGSLSESSEEFIPSPLTPSIPIRPSPSDARRKRVAKLRRHLGETVTDSMILGPPSEEALTRDKTILTSNEKTTHDLQDLIFTKMPLDSISLKSSSTSDEEEDSSSIGHIEGEQGDGSEAHPSDDDEDELYWVVNNTSSFRAGAVRRQSKKWLREKGGHRWEEQDYTDILRALRAL